MSTLEVRACCDSTINQYHAEDCKGRLQADYYFGPYEPTHTEKLLERIATALEKMVPLPMPEEMHSLGTTRETWYSPVPEYVNVLTGEDGQLHQRCLHHFFRGSIGKRVQCDGAQGHAGPHIHNS